MALGSVRPCLPDLVPAQRLADAVVTLHGPSAGPALAVVVEVQLGRDEDKLWSWPTYVVNLRARSRCPVMLLVVCPDRATAAWCTGPIDVRPGSLVQPWVLGPEQMPVVTDPDRARQCPQLAVLSAVAHGGRPAPQQRAVLESLLAAYGAIDRQRASLHHDVVLKALPAAARRHLEDLMATGTYDYQSDFARHYFGRGKAEGEAEGEAEAVMEVLTARGIEVPDEVRRRIVGCTDLQQLQTWIRHAATASSAHELFRQDKI